MTHWIARALTRLWLGVVLMAVLSGCYVTDRALFTDRPTLDRSRAHALFSGRYFELERRDDAAEDPRRQAVIATRLHADGRLDFVVYQNNEDVAGRFATLRVLAERRGVVMLWVQLPADARTGAFAQKLVATDGETLFVSDAGRGRFDRPLSAAEAAADVAATLEPARAALRSGGWGADWRAAFAGWSRYHARPFSAVEGAIAYLAGPRSIDAPRPSVGETLAAAPRATLATAAETGCAPYARWAWFIRPRRCR